MFGGRWLRYFKGSVGSRRHIISSERGSSGISVDLLPLGIHFVAAIEELIDSIPQGWILCVCLGWRDHRLPSVRISALTA